MHQKLVSLGMSFWSSLATSFSSGSTSWLMWKQSQRKQMIGAKPASEKNNLLWRVKHGGEKATSLYLKKSQTNKSFASFVLPSPSKATSNNLNPTSINLNQRNTSSFLHPFDPSGNPLPDDSWPTSSTASSPASSSPSSAASPSSSGWGFSSACASEVEGMVEA